MTIDVHHPVPPQDLSGILGHRIVYTYNNDWEYEMLRLRGSAQHV